MQLLSGPCRSPSFEDCNARSLRAGSHAHEGRAAALAILHRAADVCEEQDMRTPDVFAALAALEARATRRGAFRQFRAALTVPDPQARQAAARVALSGIERVLGAGSVPSR